MKLPDGPKTPAWIQNLQWITDPVAYMESAAKKYGDLFTTPLGARSKNYVFISNPQAIKQILSSDTKQFSAPGELNKILASLLGYTPIFMLDGDRHRQRRKLLMPPFHGERIQAYGELIARLTKQVIRQQAPGKSFSARNAMQEISLQVILQAVFGLYDGERYQQIKQKLCSLLDLFRSPLAFSFMFFPSLQKDLGPWSPWGYLQRLQRQIDELIYSEIRDRRQANNLDRADILSLLMAARDEEGKSLTDLELRDELMTLLFAGHETTASAMAWALYWIHYLPEVREKLLSELDTLGEIPDTMSILKLPYLTAVCNETLRIYPVGILTFARSAKEPIELMGYYLEPGVELGICIYLTHQRQDIYPEPKQFKPERFLDRQYSPYEFLPFGGGARRCIGEALAQLEMKVVLATILSNYKLELVDNRPIAPQRRGIILSPRGGVKMVLK
jgi:unspecific monooxygenase